MKNLNELNKLTLINMVIELDEALVNNYINIDELNYLELEKINLENQLRKVYNDYNEMNLTRQYWKDKYHTLLEEVKKLGYKKNKIKREIIEVKKKKDFKINLIKNGKKISIKDLPKKEKKLDIKQLQKQKETYKHSKESTKGNVSGTPHSGHKTKEEVLIGVFPNGDVISFDSVEEAKDYVKEIFPKLKSSPLTNISRAARGSGFYSEHHTAYGVKWSYQNKSEDVIL
jgi:hypothetical protein